MPEEHQGCSNQFLEDCCVNCKLGFKDEKASTVSRKGILTIIKYSEKRGWLELDTYLTECISVTPIRVTEQKRVMEKMLKKLRPRLLKD